MDKLKSMLGKKHEDHHDTAASSGTATTQTTGASTGGRSGGDPDNAEGVVLHTTLGDITIALFKDQTPRVSSHARA
jgi:peptidyl-prolyl cis-trans isomerase-like 1